jgi:hypothetical protein
LGLAARNIHEVADRVGEHCRKTPKKTAFRSSVLEASQNTFQGKENIVTQSTDVVSAIYQQLRDDGKSKPMTGDETFGGTYNYSADEQSMPNFLRGVAKKLDLMGYIFDPKSLSPEDCCNYSVNVMCGEVNQNTKPKSSGSQAP